MEKESKKDGEKQRRVHIQQIGQRVSAPGVFQMSDSSTDHLNTDDNFLLKHESRWSLCSGLT